MSAARTRSLAALPIAPVVVGALVTRAFDTTTKAGLKVGDVSFLRAGARATRGQRPAAGRCRGVAPLEGTER
jgi:hypothetical protein